MWATLIDSTVQAYELVLPALTAEEREQYYAESRISAGFLGLAPEDLPANWHAFQQYMETMLHSEVLGVGPAARHIAQQVLTGAGSGLRIPACYRALTAQLLPPRFREEFQLACGERQRRSVDRALRWLHRIYVVLPDKLRYVVPYLEAQEKLAGLPEPGGAAHESVVGGATEPAYLTQRAPISV